MSKKNLTTFFIIIILYSTYIFFYIKYPTNLNVKKAKLDDKYDIDYVLKYNYLNTLTYSKDGELAYNGLLLIQDVQINRSGDNCYEIRTTSLGYIKSNRKVFIKKVNENEIEYYYTDL